VLHTNFNADNFEKPVAFKSFSSGEGFRMRLDSQMKVPLFQHFKISYMEGKPYLKSPKRALPF
jgi:hypothetical protein